MKETVGAVIATYNGEKYVDQQLMSIINQDRKPDLIVISDGGSSDRTVEICREILSSSEIKYIILTSDTQLSVPINFGKAIENCCCDYIFLSDQDDYWVKDKISVTLEAMANNDVCMAFTNATITDGALNHKGTTLWDTIGFKPEDEITVFEKNDFDFIHELIRHNIVTGMTICLTSDLRDVVLPISSNAIHDKWISMLAIFTGNIVAINQELVLYRQHGNNAVGTQRNLRKSLNNKRSYLDRLIQREKMISELFERIEGIDYPEFLVNYKMYLRKRIEFLRGTTNFFSAVRLLNEYKKNEYKPLEIMIKDYIVRVSK